jgi:hypothetical protein
MSPRESVGLRSSNEEPAGPMKQCSAIAITERLTSATTPQQSFCRDAIPFLATKTNVATIKQKKMIRISWSGDIVNSIEFTFYGDIAARMRQAGVRRGSGNYISSAMLSFVCT